MREVSVCGADVRLRSTGEGMSSHAVSRVIYGMELFVLALVCEVPYDMATSGRAFDLGSQNPVFGLFIALTVLGFDGLDC